MSDIKLFPDISILKNKVVSTAKGDRVLAAFREAISQSLEDVAEFIKNKGSYIQPDKKVDNFKILEEVKKEIPIDGGENKSRGYDATANVETRKLSFMINQFIKIASIYKLSYRTDNLKSISNYVSTVHLAKAIQEFLDKTHGDLNGINVTLKISEDSLINIIRPEVRPGDPTGAVDRLSMDPITGLMKSILHYLNNRLSEEFKEDNEADLDVYYIEDCMKVFINSMYKKLPGVFKLAVE